MGDFPLTMAPVWLGFRAQPLPLRRRASSRCFRLFTSMVPGSGAAVVPSMFFEWECWCYYWLVVMIPMMANQPTVPNIEENMLQTTNIIPVTLLIHRLWYQWTDNIGSYEYQWCCSDMIGVTDLFIGYEFHWCWQWWIHLFMNQLYGG